MTDVIAIANQKGGVGKTATAVNLGAGLAAAGQRTLIIDFDPQHNATSALGLRAPEERSTYQLLFEEVRIGEIALATTIDGLSCAPASADLAGADVEMAGMMAREYKLKRALEGDIASWDIVLIDCPPSLGLLTVNALAAARDVIVPVQCEYLALEGLGQLMVTLDLVRRNLNPRLQLRGLLLTMFDRRTALSDQVADEVRRHFPETFDTAIPRSVRLGEAPSHGVPIQAYDPRSPAAAAYDSLAVELLQRIRSRQEVST
jgi:chromosome partitioning protein